MPMNTPKQQIRIDFSNTTSITCDECGNDTFIEVVYLRKVSKLLTGSPEDQLIPIPSYACAKCHHMNDKFRLTEAPEPEKPTDQIV